MMEFWTPETRLPKNLPGVPIFGPVHLAWLFPVLAFCVAAVFLFRRAKPPNRLRTLRLAGAAMPILIVARLFLLGLTNGFDPAWSLPLQLCDVMAFVECWAVFRKGWLARELSWCCGLPGALCALITPGETALPFWNIFYLIFVALHTLLFLVPLLLSAEGLQPAARRLPACFLFLLGLAGVDAICNAILHGNYLFLRVGPPGSILAVLQKWAGPFYPLTMAALVWCVWSILYGGLAVYHKLRGRRCKKREI
jgi:hypothetical integral membrane protein (TIGR02206 family)